MSLYKLHKSIWGHEECIMQGNCSPEISPVPEQGYVIGMRFCGMLYVRISNIMGIHTIQGFRA